MNWNPGINHIEYWASDAARTIAFFDAWLPIVGWRKLGATAYSTGAMEIYVAEKPGISRGDQPGPRHLCFQAVSREQVEQVAEALRGIEASIIRGPLDVPGYSEGYYTVDFKDPDGYVLEVAHTPNMTL